MAEPLTPVTSLTASSVDVPRFYRHLEHNDQLPRLQAMLRPSAVTLEGLRSALDALCGQLQSESDIASAARALLNTAALRNLPMPGAGGTAVRMAALGHIGASDLALGRVLGAHLDATAILQEAHHPPQPHALYGVWTTRHPTQPLRASHKATGWQLSGSLPHCITARQVDRALIAADAGAERLLFDVHVFACGEIVDAPLHDENLERTPAATVRFDAVHLDDRALVGGPNFYSERDGVCASALDVAAVQLGGAIGLLRAWLQADPSSAADPHALANLGASFTAVSSAALQLERTARLMDHASERGPLDRELRCLAASETRYVIEQACREVMQRMNRALGPHPQSFDAQVAQRCAELSSYLRQSHTERTLEELGAAILRAHSAEAFKTIYSWL